MHYKLVVLDMDGTLLDSKKQIPQENIDVLRSLHQMGIEIVIATGRRYLYAKPALTELDIPLIIVPNNGNSMWKMDEDKKILTKTLKPSLFYKIIREGHKRGLFPLLHVDHYEEGYDLYTEHEHDHPSYHSYFSPDLSRHKVIKNLYQYKNPKVMMLCYMDEIDNLKAFENELKKQYPGQFHSHIALSLKRLGPMLEITPPTGTKWHTILEYSRCKKIDVDEIITIGDDNNDVTMIQNAGLGIAMKNATFEAKNAASLVTEYSNDDAGVAKVLRKIFSIASS